MPDGTLYGTAFGFDVSTWQPPGVIFKVTPEGTFSVVRELDFTSGTGPFAGLTRGPGSTLYGTALVQGPGGRGVVFRLTLPAGPGAEKRP